MFTATAEVAWFVPQGKGLDGVIAISCSQSLLVDPFTLLLWMCFNCHVPLKDAMQ